MAGIVLKFIKIRIQINDALESVIDMFSAA